MLGPGELIADKYRLEHVVGRGGMGIVYAATHLQLAQRVAIKFVHTDATADPTAVASLLKEARTIARLKSEHVARVLDAGALSERDPYIVLELLSGSRLDELVGKSGPRDVAEAAELVIQTCHGLADAHSNGVVHRDIKPSNLFLTRDASGHVCVKIIDFGISKAHGRGEEATHSAMAAATLLGSPLYMSPEQLSSPQDVDARTDIWSLGIVLHYLVTGQHPFQADNLAGLMYSIARDEPAPLEGVPEAYAAVVRRCLQKDRNDRYPTVHGVAEGLLSVAPPRARWTFERMSTGATIDVSAPGGSAGSSPGQRLTDPEAPTLAVGMPTPGAAFAAGAAQPPRTFEQTASLVGVATPDREEMRIPYGPIIIAASLLSLVLAVVTVVLMKPAHPTTAAGVPASPPSSLVATAPSAAAPEPSGSPASVSQIPPVPQPAASAAASVDVPTPKPTSRPQQPTPGPRPTTRPGRGTGPGKGVTLPATPD